MSPFTYGNPVGPTWMVGGSGSSLADYQQLSTPSERASIYSKVSYEISNTIEATTSFMWARSRTVGVGGAPFDPGIAIKSDNAYLPQSVQSALVANGISQFTIGRIGKDYSED